MPSFDQALSLALEHHRALRLDEAEAIYCQILAIDPNHPQALHYLGVIAQQQGQHEPAVHLIGRALAIKPAYPAALCDLGDSLRELHKLEQAQDCYRKAADLQPGYAPAWHKLAEAFFEQGDLFAAESHYRRALEQQPALAQSHNNLGNILFEQNQWDAAIDCYRRALQIKPDFAEAHSNLGNALLWQENLDEAIACLQRAIALDPTLAAAYGNLGNAFRDQANLKAAIECYRQALALQPKYTTAHSNLLYTLYFCPGIAPLAIAAEHRLFDQQHAAPLRRERQPHANQPDPERRLRIGYVSPYFYEHCQSFFTLPLFTAHDRAQVEIIGYADVRVPDTVTAQLRDCMDQWHNIAGLTDEGVADQIRRHQVDILVDLTMHMARGRPLLFARKPAPLEVCWLAYPGTTGLSAIDYRLTDPYLDSPEDSDQYGIELPLRLPDSFWCYDPCTSEPAVGPLPATAAGHITFGCLNNFCKVNADVLELWARALHAVDKSRLLLLAAPGTHRQWALSVLAQQGIAQDRITFVPFQPRQKYLALYHHIDIALDTFPYNGHTTSLDAFWMGVPVVTLAGQTTVARGGISQLTNLGLPELIAHTPDQFVSIAGDVARDLPRLDRLRATLRERLQNSPLMDAPRFARNVESAYRQIWKTWCASRVPKISATK